jgi:hypothetical protein
MASLLICGTFLFAACGVGSNTETNAENSENTSSEPAPVINIDVTGWEAYDLSTISPLTPVIVNLPIGFRMEKNGNGGVDIMLNEAYTLTVSNLAVFNAAEAIKYFKDLSVNSSSYQNGTVVKEEANGIIYTMQMKDEENGTKYRPESHFGVVVEKDGAIYTIQDVRPMDNFFLSGSTYTVDNAQKLYDTIKASAKAK